MCAFSRSRPTVPIRFVTPVTMKLKREKLSPIIERFVQVCLAATDGTTVAKKTKQKKQQNLPRKIALELNLSNAKGKQKHTCRKRRNHCTRHAPARLAAHPRRVSRQGLRKCRSSARRWEEGIPDNHHDHHHHHDDNDGTANIFTAYKPQQ